MPNSRSPLELPPTAYRRAVEALQEARVEFLVGGGHAVHVHTGMPRSTNDFDLFLRRADVSRAMDVLTAAGYRTELAYSHWLAKAHFDSGFIDLIFNSGNGCCPVDDAWFRHAREDIFMGMKARVCPPEESIWQKAFIMERERFDGADVLHLLRACATTLDWPRLLERFGRNWPVLYAHLVLFRFVFPGDAALIPEDILRELALRVVRAPSRTEAGPLCRGTLLSRTQYVSDVDQLGCTDARLPPLGSMTLEQIARWTADAARPNPPPGPPPPNPPRPVPGPPPPEPLPPEPNPSPRPIPQQLPR